MKKKDFGRVTSVHFQEIPSFGCDSFMNFYLKNGIHLIIESKRRTHRMYISSNFKTNLFQFSLMYDTRFSNFDVLAFHIFRYIKEKCSFTSLPNIVLWKLLRLSNDIIYSITKFIRLVRAYDKLR